MKRVLITQSNYIPWKGYFDMIAHADVFVIYDEVQYTKNDWRNRNVIKTPAGPQWLTIPVRRTGLDQRICDSAISDANWCKKHIASLQANYARAPHFEHYRDRIFGTYDPQVALLSDVNRAFLKTLCDLLGITTEIVDSRDLALEGDRNGRLLDACQKLGATNYLSGPAAGDYLDVQLFRHNGIEVEWMSYAGYAEYPQLFPPFTHAVSALDLLFNAGPDAPSYMKYARQ